MIRNKRVFTITGSIATGKSSVSDIIRGMGYYVIDADNIGHSILKDKDVINNIKNEFSNDFIKNNEVDRKKLSKFLFNNRERIKDINRITHEKIISKINELINESNDNLIFVDMPLYFEIKDSLNEYKYSTDGVILVYSNLEKQILRLMKRDKIERDYALKKISSQMSVEDKRKMSDYIIDNSYDLSFLEKEIYNILNKIKGLN